MRHMKRICLLVVFAACAVGAGFGQTASTVVGGDPNEITKRIIASASYRLTPGDTLLLSIVTGAASSSYSLVVQENYDLTVPYVGTVNVKGSYFLDFRKTMMDKLGKLLPMADFLSLVLGSLPPVLTSSCTAMSLFPAP